MAVLRTMALPAGFARAVDKAVAARTRTFTTVQTTSAGALAARQERLNDMYPAGSIGRVDRGLVQGTSISVELGSARARAITTLVTTTQRANSK